MRVVCPTCEIPVTRLTSDVDSSTEYVCEFHGSVIPLMDTQGEFRGFDDEGHQVIVGWVNGDGTEYLVGLTHCCGKTATCVDDGSIVCRKCYADCSWSLAMEAAVRVPVATALMATR